MEKYKLFITILLVVGTLLSACGEVVPTNIAAAIGSISPAAQLTSTPTAAVATATPPMVTTSPNEATNGTTTSNKVESNVNSKSIEFISKVNLKELYPKSIPAAMAFDKQDNLYVVDTGDQQI